MAIVDLYKLFEIDRDKASAKLVKEIEIFHRITEAAKAINRAFSKPAFRRKFLKTHVANRRFLKRVNGAFEDNMKKLMGRHYFPPNR